MYHNGALGDFITTWPALELWRDLAPAARTVLLGSPVHGRLAMAAGLVDGWWDAEDPRWVQLYREAPLAELSHPFRGIRSALVFATERSPIPARLREAGCSDLVCQDPFPSVRRSVVDFHLELFADREPRVELFPRLRFLAASPGDLPALAGPRSVLLHPGSGSGAKNWPLVKFSQLAEELSRRQVATTWVLGPREEDLPFEPSVRNPDLETLARILAQGRLLVGNDSGVSHLAAAVGTSVVALFGPSDPAVWAPRGTGQVTVLTPGNRRSDGGSFRPVPIDRIEVDTVLQAVMAELAGD